MKKKTVTYLNVGHKIKAPTLVCKEWGTTCPGNDENLGNPVPFVGWTQPRVCGELLVGLSPQWITSLLKALGQYLCCDFRQLGEGRWTRDADTAKADLQIRRQASPGTRKVNATLKALPWTSPTAPEAGMAHTRPKPWWKLAQT